MLSLFYGRLGREPARCNGCGHEIPPQKMIIQRSDEAIFCTADCEHANPSTDAPSRRVIT